MLRRKTKTERAMTAAVRGQGQAPTKPLETTNAMVPRIMCNGLLLLHYVQWPPEHRVSQPPSSRTQAPPTHPPAPHPTSRTQPAAPNPPTHPPTNPHLRAAVLPLIAASPATLISTVCSGTTLPMMLQGTPAWLNRLLTRAALSGCTSNTRPSSSAYRAAKVASSGDAAAGAGRSTLNPQLPVEGSTGAERHAGTDV